MKYNNKTENYTDFFYKAFRNVLLVSAPLLIISALILSIPHTSADNDNSSSDNISLTLNVSCTISSSVLTPHNATLNGGQHETNIGTTKVNTYCNDNNGYNIYAIGNSGNIDGNTDLVVNGLGSEYNIKTGIYNDNDPVSLATSSWGMKLIAGDGTGIDPITGESVSITPPSIVNNYNNYNVVPSVYTMVAKRTSGTSMTTNTTASGSYFTTTYDIYASSVQPAGTYNGKVKYILTHPNTNAPSTINDIDAAFAMAGKQKVYQDSEGSYYAMQDMTTDICNSVSSNGERTSTQLVDIRDHKLYYVTKLADGHCWMTQNLDLDIGGANTATLNSNNTDISTTASGSGIYNTAGGYTESGGVWTWSPANSAVTSNHIISGTSVPGWSNSATAPYSAEGSDVYYYTSNSSGSDIAFDSLAECTTNGRTEAECKHYHRGNYYNWTAAIASNNSNGFNTQYDDAANSICPKDWRLPVAINSNQSTFEFGKLLFEQGITTAKFNSNNITSSVSYTSNGFIGIRKSPLWFTRSGLADNGNFIISTTQSYYWSSTNSSSTNSYGLHFDNSGAWPIDGGNKVHGRSVRCLAR